MIATTSKFGVFLLLSDGQSPPILTFTLGQDEDALALVRCADFTRREYSPRRLITNAFQFADDLSESEADVSLDVLKEADSGSHSSNSICDPRPEVSWVISSESLACC
jgi:hypothetical protein